MIFCARLRVVGDGLLSRCRLVTFYCMAFHIATLAQRLAQGQAMKVNGFVSAL
jgi:hypothetical protein